MPQVTTTAAGDEVHICTLTPDAEGELFGAVAGEAKNAVEAPTGGTAPFTVMAIGATALSGDGTGFWEWKEEVKAAQKPAGNLSPPLNGLETSAGPMISVTEVTMPSSYKGESLTGLSPDLDADDFGTSNIFPGINLVTSKGTNDATPITGGEGFASIKGQITGNILELNSWVDQWLPTASIPHFNGADYATVKSEGYGREIGAFEIQFKLKFHLKDFPNHSDEVEKTYSIKIINNFDNDKNQYKADYTAAYASLTKVPELNERNY